MMLTRETILSIYEEQGIEGVIAATLQMQAALLERIVRLEERLGLDSHNSSKPPSSDGPEASGSRSERRKAQRKSGGQPGHRGSTLRRVAEPDEVITHTPAECAACGCSLAGVEPESVEEQGRQVFDIPPIDMQVTEHRRAQCRCGCGHLTRADYPLDVGAPVQYGPRILALGLLLNLGHHLPLDRTRQILVDLCGAAPSQAVLIDAQQRLARAVEPSYEVIIDHLLSAEQLFVDESGVAVEGELFWVHVASTPQATLLAIDQHRGREAIEAIGLLPEYRAGQLMHDFWGSYRDLPAASHGYCSAHLLRELIRMCERSRCGSHRWAFDLADVLGEAIAARNAALSDGLDAVPTAVRRTLHRRYRYWINRGKEQFPDRQAGRAEFNLLRRLQRHASEILAFLENIRLEPTNNQAERDIRMVKLHDKISGCFRNPDTARVWALCRSYIATARKQGITFLKAIHTALLGQPLLFPGLGPE